MPHAFEVLGLPRAKMIPFRGALVQHGALIFSASGHRFDLAK